MRGYIEGRPVGTFILQDGQCFIAAPTGEEDHDLAEQVFRAISKTPSGNASLAEQFSMSLNRIKQITEQLNREFMIHRNKLNMWEISLPNLPGGQNA